MKRAALAAAATAALAAGAAPALAAPPLVVDTSLSSQFVYLGDTVTARVTVVADRRRTDPGSLRVSARFGDWAQLTPTRTASLSSGSSYRRTWSFDIACLQASCIAGRQPLAARLPRVTVSARRPDGSVVTMGEDWPKLSIAPRFGPATRGATPNFELDQSLPSPDYRVDPSGLALGLDVAAALLAAFALAVVALEVLRRRPARTVEIPALVRALAFLREAKVRPIDDRRRAAGFVAHLLARDRDGALSATASEIAWAAGRPSPERLEELARLVEADREELG